MPCRGVHKIPTAACAWRGGTTILLRICSMAAAPPKAGARHSRDLKSLPPLTRCSTRLASYRATTRLGRLNGYRPIRR
jgi:hypothetical protein